jgi:hypothetical protein
MGRKSPLTDRQWEEVRLRRERGESRYSVAKTFGVSGTTIMSREKAGGGNVSAPEGGAVATTEAQSDGVVERHREEVNAVRERLYHGLRMHRRAGLDHDGQPINPESTGQAKMIGARQTLAMQIIAAAKLASDCLWNIHRIERQAWGLGAADDDKALSANITLYLPDNGRGPTP